MMQPNLHEPMKDNPTKRERQKTRIETNDHDRTAKRKTMTMVVRMLRMCVVAVFIVDVGGKIPSY